MSSKKGLDLIRNIAIYLQESGGYDRFLKDIKFVDGGSGKCTAEFKVLPKHLNKMGGLHGGFSSTLVDSITTFALMSNDVEKIRPGVSIDLQVTFIKSARENDELIIEANTIKCGKTLAFLECVIKNKKDNSILVRGSHTKFVGKDYTFGPFNADK